MDNPETLATQGKQDEVKQSKNTTQYVLDTTMRKQTQIMLIRHNIIRSRNGLGCKIVTILERATERTTI